MKKVFQNIFSLFKKADPSRKGKARKTRGQSLVEVAIAFPVLIMLFSGVIEFGFILNYYLSLLDATRDAARFYSNGDPFQTDPITGVISDNYTFYLVTADMVRDLLDPETELPGRRIVLDPLADDVIVSVYSLDEDTVISYPDAGPYHLFDNGIYESIFTEDSILNTRVPDAPNAGILLVEIHYNYHHILGLPWMKTIISNPLPLRAYTIMPIRAAEPTSGP